MCQGSREVSIVSCDKMCVCEHLDLEALVSVSRAYSILDLSTLIDLSGYAVPRTIATI